MWDNYFKSLEDMWSYKSWKASVLNWNKKVLKFVKDAFEDITSHIDDKKED